MTIEEIRQTLEVVAGNQARLTEAQEGYGARQARLDETVKQIAEANKSLIELIRLHEERLDGHDVALQATDEKLSALIDAQVGLETRQAKLEESYQLLVQLARIQEERIDGHDGALRHTDGRLDALIDAQMRLAERVEFHDQQLSRLEALQAASAEAHDRQLRALQAATAEHAEAHDRQLSRIAALQTRAEALQAENSAQIKALVAAQASTDNLIRSLLDRNGAAKPRRKTTKPAKKKRD